MQSKDEPMVIAICGSCSSPVLLSIINPQIVEVEKSDGKKNQFDETVLTSGALEH